MKEFIIENKNKFYSNLFLYKTRLYKNVIFKTKIKDEELKNIIIALNIKKKRERIEYIYDYCCKKIDKFYDGQNICEFKNEQCKLQQKHNCNRKNGCCSLCIFQSNTGCTTANLSCKLFFCDLIKNEHNIIKFKDLKILKLYNFRQKIISKYNYFAKREEFLKDLKNNSILLYTFGIIKRNLRKRK